MGTHSLASPSSINATHNRKTHGLHASLLFFCAGVITTLILVNYDYQYLAACMGLHSPMADLQPVKKPECRPPLPPLFANNPPRSSESLLVEASSSLDQFLKERTSKSDIDSLSVAIVTPSGPIFERGYGILKANETHCQGRREVDKHSIYRIASITKMFTVLETLILRERGVLSWDDPVDMFLPNFTYQTHGWSEYLRANQSGTKRSISDPQYPPITLRQLASHLSGIGRDYPPQHVEGWPLNSTLPHFNISDYTLEHVLENISRYPLIAPQYTYPVYSNTGMSILGLSNVAANRLANGKDEPATHADLIKRDIFDPLGFNSSFYAIPDDEKLVSHIAVPSEATQWTDLLMTPAFQSAGGQYSSLSDLSKLMQTLLSPSSENGIISPSVVREWLRPLHGWSDGIYEVGAPWEIIKLANEVRVFAKAGSLPGYHSQFALNPQYSYGVIVLETGPYADSQTLVQEVLGRFQPAFEKLFLQRLKEQYAGTWSSPSDGHSATISLIDDSLYISKLVISGHDALHALQKHADSFSPTPPSGNFPTVALWSTGREGEFRLAIGRPYLNNVPGVGCEPYWISIDGMAFSRGAPVDLLYFEDGELVYPSGGARLARAGEHAE